MINKKIIHHFINTYKFLLPSDAGIKLLTLNTDFYKFTEQGVRT